MFDLAEKIGFPAEAVEELEKAKSDIEKSGAFPYLEKASEVMYSGEPEFAYIDCLDKAASESKVMPNTVYMVFVLMCATATMKEIFLKKDIPEEIYIDTCRDIRCKLMECKNVYGYYGTFAIKWYCKILSAKVLKLGRLEYEPKLFAFDESYGDILKKGKQAYSIHIPSAGPLSPESVMDSLKTAYKFFKIEGIMPAYTCSWLIYPPHYELFPENSNLRKFFELFDVFKVRENKTNSDMWRIFNVPPETPYDMLPTDNRLRRNFSEYLNSGKNMGDGIGALPFDGEKIVKL